MSKTEFLNYCMSYAPHLMRLIVLAAMAHWGIGYLENKIKKALAHIYPDELRLSLIGSLFYYTAMSAVFVAALYECGINTSALLGIMGVIGIAVGYAAKTGVANVISGFFLMLEQPIKLGDILLIDVSDSAEGKSEGKVIAVNLFAITVQMQDRTVRIPHEKLVKNNIIKLKKNGQ